MADINFKLDSKSIEVLKDISAGIGKRIDMLVKENPVIKDILVELKSTMFEELGIDEDANKTLRAYIDFISKSGVLSYYGRLDNDKNVERLKEKGDVELEFAFSNFGNMISSTVEFFEDSEKSTGRTVGCIQSCLLSLLREISLSEYVNGNYAEKDIRLIAVLGNKSKSELNEFIMNFIKNDDTINSYYVDSLEQVLTTYKYLFQDSFGLKPYVGVVSFSDPNHLLVIDDCMKLNTISGARATFDSVRSSLEKSFDVTEILDRQFDVKKVITGDSAKPYYYPVKMLEYAMGRELTYELSEKVYRPYANSDSWDSYASGYVRPQIEEYFKECIYYSLERHFNYGGCSSDGVDEFFLSDGFSGVLAKKGEASIKAYMSSVEMAKSIKADINRLKRCMCTAVLVVKYMNMGKQISLLTLRCVNTTGDLSVGLSRKIFSSFTSNESTKFEDGDVISAGKYVGGDANKPLPYEIIEYRHDFDSTLATVEPLFGYKAVELFQRRGVKLGWDKILLGEDIKGTPVFASMLDTDDLPMQKKTVHNMMAGSRAGKGVMTMNVLVSGLASGKPIFYIDRKPDMAVLFYELSQGNMFVVNGGQFVGKNDINGFFDGKGNGLAIEGWASAYDSMPEYLKKDIFVSRDYARKFGDMVYFRAILFTLGLLMARVELSDKGDVYSKLGGDNGVIIIVDEFKNWQVNFEKDMFEPGTGVFGNKFRIKKQVAETRKKAEDDIIMKQAVLGTLDESDPKNVAKVTKLNLEIENLRKKMSGLVTETMVYCTSVADKYGESIKHISEVLSAGFKDGEGRISDVFVIGQHIDIDGIDGAQNASGLYPQRDGGDFNVNNDTKGKSLMRGIFDRFEHDWFMGYNHESDTTRMYMGANKAGSPSKKWLDERQYWAYCADASIDTLRTSCPSNAVFFKPYLVLNKHFEDDPKNPKKINVAGEEEMVTHPDYTFVTQCRSRVNDAVPNLWETVRLKHLKSEEAREEAISGVNKHYDELNEGIGFQGLANLTKQCNGLGNFNPATDLGESKNIADYVAQCMGYSGYMELLMDFSPRGIFSTRDICSALTDPVKYQASLAERLPLFVEYGFMSGNRQEELIEEPQDESSYDEDLYADLEGSDVEQPENGEFSDFADFTGEQPAQEASGSDQFNMSGFGDEEESYEENESYEEEPYSEQTEYEEPHESEDYQQDMYEEPYASEDYQQNMYEEPQSGGLTRDDIIQLTAEVTTNVFVEFSNRYGRNVSDEYVRCAITTRATELVYRFISSQEGGAF